MAKTRFFRRWLSGTVGAGPVVSVYWQPDPRIVYPHCERLDGQISVYQRWAVISLQIGEVLELSDGSALERVS